MTTRGQLSSKTTSFKGLMTLAGVYHDLISLWLLTPEAVTLQTD